MKEEKIRDDSQDEREETNEALEWIKSIVIAVIIALFIKTFIFNTTYVVGNSMYPTLHEEDRLIANKLPLYFSGVERGDIVLIDAPDDRDKKYIKRAVALEGDIIEIIDGRVYLNGEELIEDYIENNSYTHTYNDSYWEIREDEVFVLGDNRLEGASKDSRFFGPIHKKTIKGITKLRFFPFGSRFGRLD